MPRELAQRKNDEEARRREIQQICERDEGLRELQRKLKTAYVNKERALSTRNQSGRASSRKEEEAKVDAMGGERESCSVESST